MSGLEAHGASSIRGYNLDHDMLRIKSVEEPFVSPSLAAKGAAVLAKADAMGLFPERELTVRLDAGTLGRLAARLGRAGIGGAVMAMLTSRALAREPKMLEQYLDQLSEALEASPVRSEEHTSELQSRVDLVCR